MHTGIRISLHALLSSSRARSKLLPLLLSSFLAVAAPARVNKKATSDELTHQHTRYQGVRHALAFSSRQALVLILQFRANEENEIFRLLLMGAEEEPLLILSLFGFFYFVRSPFLL